MRVIVVFIPYMDKDLSSSCFPILNGSLIHCLNGEIKILYRFTIQSESSAYNSSFSIDPECFVDSERIDDAVVDFGIGSGVRIFGSNS